MNREQLIRKGFITAGGAAIGSVLLFSLAFTNDFLFSVDPSVITPLGLLMVQLWGLAAIAASEAAARQPWLVLVFAAEKLAYVVVWCHWMATAATPLTAIFEQDLLSGIFFAVYGPFDLLLLGFFLWVFLLSTRPVSVVAPERP